MYHNIRPSVSLILSIPSSYYLTYQRKQYYSIYIYSNTDKVKIVQDYDNSHNTHKVNNISKFLDGLPPQPHILFLKGVIKSLVYLYSRDPIK